MIRPKILVITPVDHINEVGSILESFGDVTYLNDPSHDEVCSRISTYDAIFTNPNKSKVYIGSELIGRAKNLKVICTASTGTNHIDLCYASSKGVRVLCLKDELEIIEKISSTAELAFTLTLNLIRNIIPARQSVLDGDWDYTKFIGRQMNELIVGVIGYGRLGKKYAQYCKALGAKVVVFDPYKKVELEGIDQVYNLDTLISQSDVISIHVHVTNETVNLLNSNRISKLKKDVLVVNTSRGEVIDEKSMVEFLEKNKFSRLATDVLANEINGRFESPLLKMALKSDRILITPHIGGMTTLAQSIAYGHAAKLLKSHMENR